MKETKRYGEKMVWVNIKEISDLRLSWAVADAIGASPKMSKISGIFGYWVNSMPDFMEGCVNADGSMFRPTLSWAQCGPLIEKYKMQFREDFPGVECHAFSDGFVGRASGKTYLIAACRALVSLKLGEMAKVPEDLSDH